MHIWLNDKPITLVTGMKIRDAVIQAGLLQETEKGGRVFDEWGNEVGLDGAVENGCHYTLKTKE